MPVGTFILGINPRTKEEALVQEEKRREGREIAVMRGTGAAATYCSECRARSALRADVKHIHVIKIEYMLFYEIILQLTMPVESARHSRCRRSRTCQCWDVPKRRTLLAADSSAVPTESTASLELVGAAQGDATTEVEASKSRRRARLGMALSCYSERTREKAKCRLEAQLRVNPMKVERGPKEPTQEGDRRLETFLREGKCGFAALLRGSERGLAMARRQTGRLEGNSSGRP